MGFERLIIIMFVLSSVLFLQIPSNGAVLPDDRIAGAMDPSIWVETEQDSYSFCVEPGHVEEGVILGTLFCEFQTGTPRGTQVTVDMIIISNNLGYYGTVQHTFVKGSQEDEIDFRIDLMELTSLPADLEYSMTMYPNWYNTAANRQGMGEEKTISVDILPYGGVLVNPPNPQNFNVGEEHRMDISIKNMGNSVATFKVKVEAEDLELSIPLTDLRIESGKVGDYPVYVKQPSGIGREGDIRITVSSEVPGDHDRETIIVHYKTQTSVGDFMLRPVPLALTFLLIALLITGTVLLIRRIKRSRPIG